MRATIIALAVLAAVGAVAFDGLAGSVGLGGVVTGTAAAQCIEDGVTGKCHHVCPPLPPPVHCTM